MKRSAMAVAALLAACNTTPPELLPPPFGPDGPQPTRLFFPTGLAKIPDGTLLVANGNFNHAFDSGTVVSISRSYLDSVFRDGRVRGNCDVANAPPGCTANIPQDQFPGTVMIGSYAGPLALNGDGTAAYTGSRDSGLLNALRVDPGGLLHCAPGTGNDAAHDCRKGLDLDLVSRGVDGPYSIAPGTALLPGTATPQAVFFLSSIIPHIDQISSGVIYTSTAVAVLDMQALSASSPLALLGSLLYTMRAGSQFVANGAGVGPMVFDAFRRQLYLAGCYTRSSSLGAGQPGSLLCSGASSNFLRILNVDSGDAADPAILDLRSDILSTYTVQLLLGDPDPVTQAPRTLWATMRQPDTLVRIELPSQPSVTPRVRKAIPLPILPADLVRIERTGASDLIAVVAEKQNSVAIVDTTTDEVVRVVSRLGDSPFMIRQIDCPLQRNAADPDFSGSACLAASVFGACRVALIEVPKANPSQATLSGLAGTCP